MDTKIYGLKAVSLIIPNEEEVEKLGTICFRFESIQTPLH